MSTVIDELVVVLGLDTRKFTEGQRDALAAFKKTKDGAIDFGKSVEEQGTKMSEIFGIARKGALSIIGAFAGAEIAGFVDHIVKMDAATGRMSRNVGMAVPSLSTWQYMIKQVGGEAETANSTLLSLTQTLQRIRTRGGTIDPNMGTIANQVGFNLMGTGTPDEFLRKIQSFFSGEIAAGRTTSAGAAARLADMGLPMDMVNLLLGDFHRIEEAARAAGVASKESADASEKLQAKFSTMVQAVERFAAGLIPLLDTLMKPVDQLGKDDAKKFLPSMTFDKGSVMDRLDTWLWGEYGQHDTAAGGSGGGGSRGNRNNNPGNMEDGAFARSHGAIGSDGRFAIFPDAATGAAAQAALVQGNSYSGLTLEQFGNKYSEGNAAWKKTVGDALGIGLGDIVNNKDPRLLDAIRRAEGTGARGAAAARMGGGTRGGTDGPSVSQTNTFHIKSTDPSGAAKEVKGVLERQSSIAGINNAMV